MVAWRALLLSIPLLAGCLGDGSPADAPASTPSETFAVAVGAPEPTRYTNVLHFLDKNLLTTAEPDAYEPIRIPIYSPVAEPGSQRLTLWNFTWPADVSLIRGVLDLTVDVQGLVAGSPYAVTFGGESSFWCVYIEVYDPSWNTVERDEAGNAFPCEKEPAVVAEGQRRIQLPFELPGTRFAAGYAATMLLSVDSYGRAPDARIDLLTGSITHDSTISFEGVGWPADLGRVTLLTTT